MTQFPNNIPTPSTPPAEPADALSQAQGQVPAPPIEPMEAPPEAPQAPAQPPEGQPMGQPMEQPPGQPAAPQQPQPQPQRRVPRSSVSPIRQYMDNQAIEEAEKERATETDAAPETKVDDTVEWIAPQYRDMEGVTGISLRTGSIADRTAAKTQISEHRENYRRTLIDKHLPALRRNKELFPNDDAIVDATLEQIAEAVGVDLDSWTDQEWVNMGLVPERDVDLTNIASENRTRLGREHQEKVRKQGLEDHQALVDSVGVEAPEGYIERLYDYWTNPFGGTDFETGTRKRLLAQAKNEHHLGILIDAELNRYTRASAGLRQRRKELGTDDAFDQIDDMSWQFGLAHAFGQGFSDAMASVPESLASLGSLAYIGLGKAVGADTSMWENFVDARANDMAMDAFHKGELLDAYATSAGDGFWADTMYRAAETGGMLAFDAATSFLTGKTKIIDGTVFLGKAIGRGGARLSTGTVRMTVDEVFNLGKGATNRFTNRAGNLLTRNKPPAPHGPFPYKRPPSQTVRQSVGDFFNKPRQSANTFVARVGGDAFAQSYARQMERAAVDGRDVDLGDWFKASRDSIANMAIATLIGKNIPGVKKFPPTSQGLKNSGPFKPGTMAAALDRAMGRTMLQGLRSGRDFVFFDLLMDAYSLTDSEDRAQTLHAYINEGDEKLKHLFGSFLIGGMIGSAHLPGNWKLETKRWNEYKSGQEAWREWSSMTPVERKQLLDQRSHEFRLGMQEQLQAEIKLIKENPELLKDIPIETLAEMLFYGTNTVPDVALMSGEMGVPEARFYIKRTEPKDPNASVVLADRTGEIPVTRAMVMAEAARRGLTTDVAQFSNGKVNFLFESRPQIQARRQSYTEKLRTQKEKVQVKPPSPKTIREVPIDPKAVALFAAGKSKEAFGEADRRNVLRAAERNARLSGDARSARRLRELRRAGGFRTEASLSSDARRFYDRARVEYLRGKTRQSPETERRAGGLFRVPKAFEFAEAVVRRNPDLARWVVNQVHLGRPLNKILSRRMVEKLVGKENAAGFRTAISRGNLAYMIATNHPGLRGGRLVRSPKLETAATEVVRTSPEQAFRLESAQVPYGPPTRTEAMRGKLTDLAERNSLSTRLEPDRMGASETRKQATERGVGELAIESQLGDRVSSPQELRPEGIDREIKRLESVEPTSDPIGRTGTPGMAAERQRKLAKALKWAKGFMRYTDVEIPYLDVERSPLLEALGVFEAYGTASGGITPVVVSRSSGTRGRKRVHFINDVLMVEAGTPITHARAEGARVVLAKAVVQSRRDAPIDAGARQWVRRGEFNAGEWILSEKGLFPIEHVAEIYKAATGVEMSPAKLEATLASSSPEAQFTFLTKILPHLTHKQRGNLIRYNPKIFAAIVLQHNGLLVDLGFTNPRLEGGGALLSKKQQGMLESVVESPATSELLAKGGSLKGRYISLINNALDRGNAIGGNPAFVLAQRRLERIRRGDAVTDPATRKRREETGEPILYGDEIAARRDANAPMELVTKEGINEPLALQLEKDNPGILNKLDNIESNPNYGKGVPIVVEHNGVTYEVNQTLARGRKGQYQGPLTTIRVQEQGTVDRRGKTETDTMTPEQREASDKVAELIEKGKESTTVDVGTELAPPGEGAPPKPPKPPKPGEPGKPEGGEPLEITENPTAKKSLMRRIFDPLEQTLGNWFQDPLNKAIQTRSARALEAVNKLFLTESAASDAKGRDLFEYNKARRAVEKDSGATIFKPENRETLVKILETPIPPEAINTHPLTRGLRQSEKDYIKTWRNIHEQHRQSIMDEKRRAVRMAYEYGTVKQNEARIREAKPEWKVTVIGEKGTRRKRFVIETEKSRHNLTREQLPEFMANQLVPADAGYKFSYMPHMFFGRYRGTITVTNENGVDVGVYKFGVGESNKRDLERAEILDYAANLLKDLKAKHEGLTFRTSIKETSAVAPQDAVYMPMRARRNLVDAIASHTDAHRSEINAALSGKVTSKPVATPFLAALLKREGAENFSKDIHKIMEVAINNFHRNQMGKQIQRELTPIIEAMRTDPKEPAHMADYIQDLANHVVFGTRNFERALAQSTSPAFVRASDAVLSGLRSFQFYRQLVRPAQHVINSTQVGQIWALLGTKEFNEARKAYNSPEGKQFLKDWGFFDQTGFDAGKFGDSLTAGTARGLALIHAVGNKATGGKWNMNSEMRNQNFSFFAMARHAKKNLNMSDKEAAQYGRIWGSLFTQYRFAKANDPVFLRGNVMKTLGQFKRFQIQTLGMAVSLAMNARTPGLIPGVGRSALARFMLLNTVLGGYRGSLVGFGMAASGAAGLTVYSALKQMFDDEYLPSLPDNPFKSEAAAYKWMSENVDGKLGEVPIAEMAMFGVGRLVGLDTSGNFSLTNLGPGGLGDYFLGPSIGMVHRVYQDAFAQRDALNRPAATRMFESLIEGGAATRSVKALYEYLLFADRLSDMNPAEYESTMLGLLSEGKRRTGTSEFVTDRGHMEFMAEIMGFRPADYGAQVMLASVGKMVDETWTDARNRVAATYNTDPAKAMSMMDDWNAAYGALAPMRFADIRIMADRSLDRVTLPRNIRDIDRRTPIAEQTIGELTAKRSETPKDEPLED